MSDTDSVLIRRVVSVKVIITEDYKERMIEALRDSLREIEMELQQLEFQSKRSLAEAERQNIQQAVALREQIEAEKQGRNEAKARITAQLREVEGWEAGKEVYQGALESMAEVRIGDNLNDIMNIEMVLKDGVVVDIRRV